MTKTATTPLGRLATVLLDVCQLADDTFDQLAYEPTVERCEAARAAVMAEALAFWQVETKDQVLTPEYVTEVLTDMRTAITEQASGIVADVLT